MTMQPFGAAERTTIMQTRVLACALMAGTLLVTGCESRHSDPPVAGGGRSPSNQELARATAIANDKIQAEDANIRMATATIDTGPVSDSNTGHRCSSNRVLRIQLIGEFPNIVTTGGVHAGSPADPDQTADVTAMWLIADADSGPACNISVETGHPTVQPGGIELHVD